MSYKIHFVQSTKSSTLTPPKQNIEFVVFENIRGTSNDFSTTQINKILQAIKYWSGRLISTSIPVAPAPPTIDWYHGDGTFSSILLSQERLVPAGETQSPLEKAIIAAGKTLSYFDDTTIRRYYLAIDCNNVGGTGTLAAAGPTYRFAVDGAKNTTFYDLPQAGFFYVNKFYLAAMEAGNTAGVWPVVDGSPSTRNELYTTVIHEVGHALGVGPLWYRDKQGTSGAKIDKSFYVNVGDNSPNPVRGQRCNVWYSTITEDSGVTRTEDQIDERIEGKYLTANYPVAFNPYNTSSNTQSMAVVAYNSAFSTSTSTVSLTAIPLESGLGVGSFGGHWAEGMNAFNPQAGTEYRVYNGSNKWQGGYTLQNELMTPVSEGNRDVPISQITYGALQDLGWVIDDRDADIFEPRTLAVWNPASPAEPQLRVVSFSGMHNVNSWYRGFTGSNFTLYKPHLRLGTEYKLIHNNGSVAPSLWHVRQVPAGAGSPLTVTHVEHTTNTVTDVATNRAETKFTIPTSIQTDADPASFLVIWHNSTAPAENTNGPLQGTSTGGVGTSTGIVSNNIVLVLIAPAAVDVTPTPTPSNTRTPSITPTNTPTSTKTPAGSPTPSRTPPTPTPTPTKTFVTPSITPTRTPTRTYIHPSSSPTPTITRTPTKTFVRSSPTPTPTITRTSTRTPTVTRTVTPSPDPLLNLSLMDGEFTAHIDNTWQGAGPHPNLGGAWTNAPQWWIKQGIANPYERKFPAQLHEYYKAGSVLTYFRDRTIEPGWYSITLTAWQPEVTSLLAPIVAADLQVMFGVPSFHRYTAISGSGVAYSSRDVSDRPVMGGDIGYAYNPAEILKKPLRSYLLSNWYSRYGWHKDYRVSKAVAYNGEYELDSTSKAPESFFMRYPSTASRQFIYISPQVAAQIAQGYKALSFVIRNLFTSPLYSPTGQMSFKLELTPECTSGILDCICDNIFENYSNITLTSSLALAHPYYDSRSRYRVNYSFYQANSPTPVERFMGLYKDVNYVRNCGVRIKSVRSSERIPTQSGLVLLG